jgi:hypothetical protein
MAERSADGSAIVIEAALPIPRRYPSPCRSPDFSVHHGRLDEGVLLPSKPYRKPTLAVMVRQALERSALPVAQLSATD